MRGRILIVDDDQSLCEMFEADLRRRDFIPAWSTSADEAFTKLLKNEDFDVLLTDLKLSGMNGIELCERIVANRPDVPVIVMTAFGSLETAIDAIRAGAYDFVTKPVDIDMLALILDRAVKYRALQDKVKILSDAVKKSQQFEELIGNSPPMRDLFVQLTRIADTKTTVLITGESGTGKELVARALHEKGPRRSGPFVALNCAALPETVLESELFGHKRGAFTDAQQSRKGLFLQASGGTLFLDEIGDFPIALQPKLLRALEERSVRPLGSDEEIAVDVRILTSTNRDIESAVEDGRFREDLYYRLNVIRLDLPPLRSRGTDIILLTHYFIEEFALLSGKRIIGISNTAAERLLDYAWPGNVRELRNAMERAVMLTNFENIAVEDLPEKIRAYSSSHVLIGSEDPADLLPMEAIEQRYILHVLKAVSGNRTLAARVLGMDRKTLYRRLQSYGVD